jgi:tripartite-type tricarboxylate transporter receptor subunit TctC
VAELVTLAPTLAEVGLKDFDIGTWFGVLAPKGTPKEITDKLLSEMVKIIQSPDFKKRMDEIGAEPIGDSPEAMAMAKKIKEETEKFAKLVKQANGDRLRQLCHAADWHAMLVNRRVLTGAALATNRSAAKSS